MESEKQYAAIDLKSFYASVECRERGLDPLKVNLVVADEERTEKTICLAVTPALKNMGVSGRPRLFEVNERVKQLNNARLRNAPGHRFTGGSVYADELEGDPSLSVEFLIARPRMAFYLDYSRRVFDIYSSFVAPEDIHVYSVDEVFLDLTGYLSVYGLTARELTEKMIRAVFKETGITATAGIGPNLYLSKIAMDITAKHMPPDENGVRIASLDEMTYRRTLWTHTPITDFWRVGHGTAARLAEYGMYTMGDVARCSLGAKNERLNMELLYKLFGVNAELLIDHAWGVETCTIRDIRAYRPESNSLSNGQVLSCPYPFEKGRLIAREMTDQLSLALVEKDLVCDQVVLTVCYDNSCLQDPAIRRAYRGKTETDRYGREVPKAAHGSANLPFATASGEEMLKAVTEIYDRTVDRRLSVRRLYVVANHVREDTGLPQPENEQTDMFTDPDEKEREREERERKLEKEKRRQQAVVEIRKRFGSNAILRGMNLEEGATARERSKQIGGHRA